MNKVKVISETKQEYEGVVYYLCGNYFQRDGIRLHRHVWESINGRIPEGMHVHHMDDDTHNNEPENLELKPIFNHHSDHMSKPERVEQSREHIKIAHKAACEWHGSQADLEWHSEQGKKNWEKRTEIEYECTNCGCNFATKHIYKKGVNKFCSNKCRAAYRRKQNKDIVEVPCEICGTIRLISKYNRATLCKDCARKVRWGK